MNIFLLDQDIQKCARYHCDQHVVKMTLEYAQILCTVLHLNGKAAPYRPTHQRHPCVIWVGLSVDNWIWLKELTHALNQEYKYRRDAFRNHASFEAIKKHNPPRLPSLGLIEHPQVMPEQYKVSGKPVQAYRNFYILDKSRFASWSKRKKPFWYRSRSIVSC